MARATSLAARGLQLSLLKEEKAPKSTATGGPDAGSLGGVAGKSRGVPTPVLDFFLNKCIKRSKL